MPTQRMGEKAVLVVSDLHCGSIYGMLPPDFKTASGAPVILNVGQQYLWNCWLHFGEKIAGLPIVAAVVNGDANEGEDRRCKGAELCLPIPGDQAECAATCLRKLQEYLPPGVPFYVIRGTPYHDSEGGREAEAVAEKIGARQYNGHGAGRWCHRALDLDIDGVIGNFSHGTSVAVGFYRATPADREGIWSALAGKEGKLPRADYVVRAHAHNYCHVEHASKHIVIGPCWQLQTDYMGKNSVYRMVPDIGAVLCWIDGAAKERGEDPVYVQKELYPLPPMEAVKL